MCRLSETSGEGGVSDYPNVVGEFKTLELVLSGRSIARYGDGEFKMAANPYSSIKSQEAHPKLSQRLREILHKSGDCLVGIPNINEWRLMTHEKAGFWRKHAQFSRLLADRQYVSSFITRPDSAPWINTDEYWAQLETLWRDQDVTLVRGSGKSFTAERLMLAGAKSVKEVVPEKPQHAWQWYDELLERIGRPTRALLCLGPTATVMAVDLCAKGVHAVDCGHAGMFWKKWKSGEQMVVTSADRVEV